MNMDIIAILRPEHKDVTGILEKLEATAERAAKPREKIFSTFYDPLFTLTDFDEKYFLPIVR